MEPQLYSTFKNTEITIDGKDSEWIDNMIRCGVFSIGVANDNDNLYLCLCATDKKTKAQLTGLFRQEFTIWFDPDGGRKKKFGLRFSNDSAIMDEKLFNRLRFLKTQMFQTIAQEMMENLEIEIMRNDYPVALLSEVKGIDFATSVSLNGRKLIYELKIPLKTAENLKYAIGINKNRNITVGLSTSEIDFWAIQKEFERNMRDGNRGMAANMAINEELQSFRYVDLRCMIKLAEENVKN